MTDEGLDGPELGAELADLYRAGTVWMPELADHVRAASQAFPGEELEWACRRAFDLGLTDAGPYPAWRALADTLVGYLDRTELSLRDCGEAMVLAGRDYETVDAAAFDEFNRQADRIDADNERRAEAESRQSVGRSGPR